MDLGLGVGPGGGPGDAHPPADLGHRPVEELGQQMRVRRKEDTADNYGLKGPEPILDSGDNLSPLAFPLGRLTAQRAKARPIAEPPNSLPKTTGENAGSPAPRQCARSMRASPNLFHWPGHSRLAPYRLLGDVVSAATGTCLWSEQNSLHFFSTAEGNQVLRLQRWGGVSLVFTRGMHSDFWRVV